MWELIFLLLPIAAASGWYIGNRNNKSQIDADLKQHSQNYVLGVNYLLNEQPDKAVDIFIKALEVDSDTVETHLALGMLFRRRGEVDRAIRIHQNLIARPQLTKVHKTRAILALGQDYLKAGFLDRSERLFLEVIASGEQIDIALRHLLDIYQQQRNWQQAINLINQYQYYTKEPVLINLAHYYCEYAQMLLTRNLDESRSLLKRALGCDPNCVRANVLLAELEIKAGNTAAAIKAYKQIKQQDPEYFSEIIPALVNCYHDLNDIKALRSYLWECYQEKPNAIIVLFLADIIAKQQDSHTAAEFLAAELTSSPSLTGLQRLLELYRALEADDNKRLVLITDIVNKLIANKSKYRCKHCGIHSKLHYWQCPGCRHWGTIKPFDPIAACQHIES